VSVVDLQDITVVRNGNTLLDRVSWSIEPGAHAVLLGANGSGKTTLLKVLTGYEWPTSGRVFVLGEAYGACDLRALRRRIGWVSSVMEHRLPTHEPARAIVGTGFDATLAIYRPLAPAEVERCDALLAHLRISGLAERPFGLLSQGEQKRVLIARALVHDPPLLVLDEPCAGLDPASRVDFLDDLGRFAHRADGPTLLLVTHHVEEIRPWIQTALALRHGRVVKRGSRNNVLTSDVIEQIFGRPCTLEYDGAEYRLHFAPSGD
jgi:iron complex transport system ATP-binding protein